MAVVVPFVMAAAGASATTIAITSVAFAVTGISAKINKVAAGVFGEDLVKIGNIFGAAYAAWNGGFDIGGSGGAAEAAGAAGTGAGADAFTGMEAMGAEAAAADQFSNAGSFVNAGADSLSNAASGGFNLADMAGGADLMGLSDPSIGGLSGYMGQGADAGLAATGAQAAGGVATQPLFNFDDVYQTQNTFGAGASGSAATAAEAAGTTAAGTNAAGAQATQAPRSVFDRIALDSQGNVKPAALQLGGSLIQGVGQGYAGAQASKQRAAELAEMRRRMNVSTGIRVTN